MSAVAAIAGSSNDDDVVCTPDFPLEPLCEVAKTFSLRVKYFFYNLNTTSVVKLLIIYVFV